jgi:hypothetical protein
MNCLLRFSQLKEIPSSLLSRPQMVLPRYVYCVSRFQMLIFVIVLYFVEGGDSGSDAKRPRRADAYTSDTVIQVTPTALYQHMLACQRSNGAGNQKYSCRVPTLSREDLNRPFVGREYLMKQATKVFQSNAESHKLGSLSDRRNYIIPAVACIPGMGKTHILNKLEEVALSAGVGAVHMALIVQYYNGQSVQWIDDSLSVECALCWRLMYVVFLRDFELTFAEFCCGKFLPANCGALTLVITLETLRLALIEDASIKFCSTDTMVVTLGIDEFQKIAAEEADQKARLSELCLSLYSASYSRGVKVYPMFAGTDWGLIRDSGRSSGLPVRRLPVPLLTASQVDQMLQPLLGDLLFTSALASKHLFVLGSLPRAALMYSKGVARLAGGGGQPGAEELEELYSRVYRDFAAVWQDSPSLQAQLLALCFTMRDVTNGYPIKFSVNGRPDTVSVRKLADSGYCLINSVAGSPAEYISVPYVLVHLFAQCTHKHFSTEAERSLLRSVQWLVKHVDNRMYSKPRWELSEDFGCAYMACRINSFLVLEYETVEVLDLWAGALCNVPPGLQVKLRPTEVVVSGAPMSADIERMIPEKGRSRMLDWLAGSEQDAYVFCNGFNGATTDNFFSMPEANSSDRYVVFVEQTKDVAAATISDAKVRSLLEAQSAVVPEGHTVVRCLRNPFPRTSKGFTADQLPDNAIVVLRGQFQLFYGMFSDHPAATAYPNVNECNKAQLKALGLKMLNGSAERAVRLVWNRVQQARFESQDEFEKFMTDSGIYIEKGLGGGSVPVRTE